MPQIEVTFDIDANGILHVSAKDKATGKEQSIQIKASSGLTEAEIERMVKDAEAHAEEDKKFSELIAARNQAEQLAHGVEKSLKEFGDKVEGDERKGIEDALAALREALKGDDKADIDAKTEALGQASAKLAERMYAAGQAQAGEAGAAAGEAPNAGGDTTDGGAPQGDVVDAEFEEVKDDKKKSA
jgi:molecular chaperone DnaK